MNLYHLRYFVTLAHMSHYTLAAQELGITQPSLSHAISSLEGELGIKLFEKAGRNITLTKYGKAFLEEIEPTIQNIDYSVERMKFASKGNDTLSLAFLRVLGVFFVPRLLQDFSAQFPSNSMRYIFHGDKNLSADIITDLKEKRVEVAFCSKMGDDENITYLPVCHEKLVVIVPEDHPLAERDIISLQETVNYGHIFFAERSGLSKTITTLYMDHVGKLPPINFSLDEDQVVSGFVSQGFGIAIVPDMPILKSLPLKILELEETDYERNFYLCYLNNVYHTPIVDKFINFVKEYAKDNPLARVGI